ncbi:MULTISPECIES: aldo/keto reductase [unclassified Nocardioides]|uniref:aldo/keto reductase n=1 Tax=unclassified Nocardioides TaxID=2615069 RepID=UPI0009F065A8|nr:MULTISPECIES: aldo/keto reductase [unclassified Nocardioides]GAW48144.1 aldo/keto reductase [Nocardioides sp. PD653-B2]GAW53400.1 aldo/keto reductase [Nocardioides sp. PD653]
MDLVLGTMYFGTRTDEATSFALLDRFVQAGGRVLDTANCYSFWSSPTGHGGQSEAVLGRWLAANPGLRPELVIATKVGVEPTDDGGPEGLSARVIEREAGRSRERLGVDAIDLYWAHREDRSTDLEETVAAFGALVRDGAVRRLGVSNHPTWRVEQARSIAARLGVEPYTALQLTTSYVEPRPGAHVPGKDHRFGFVTDETVDYLQAHPEIDLWVYSPLVQGSYDRADRPFPEAYDHPGTTSRLAALHILARDRRVPASQVVLAWLVAKGWKPIVGVSSVEQLESALASDRIGLTPEELAVLR